MIPMLAIVWWLFFRKLRLRQLLEFWSGKVSFEFLQCASFFG